MQTHLRRISLTSLVIAALFVIGCQSSPDELPAGPPQGEAGEMSADPVDNGEIAFALYCVSCHGESGSGDGPVAVALKTPPTDLTKLTVQYGGVFPAEEIYAYVDGRKDVEAHGTREMPVWGNIWSDVDGAEAQEMAESYVDVRLRELVEYIRTLQAEE